MNKDEYILRMMTKVSKKRWEYFVVSRIIHGLSDLDIEFVTQQLVRRPNGDRALTDMYFPQFGIHLEIDEDHHKQADNTLADKKRAEDIVSVTEHQIYRIDASVSLYDVMMQTDIFVSKLIGLRDAQKSEGTYKPWDFEGRYNPEKYRGVAAIKVSQNILFRRQCDALRLFGYTGGNYQRGTWKLTNGDGSFVWFPRLYKQDRWDNELSPCGKQIVERAIKNQSESNHNDLQAHYSEDFNRIVFARAKDALGHTLYRFVGTFRHNSTRSKPGENYFDLMDSEQLIKLPPVNSYG